MTNLLKNPSFEDPLVGGKEQHKCLVITPDPAAQQPYYYSERGEINNPAGWTSWYVHDRRPPEHDPSNPDGWCEPEVRSAPHAGRQLDGLLGHIMFTFFRIHNGGYYQQVSGVKIGDKLRGTYNAHAWTSNGDDPKSSEWVGSGAYYATVSDGTYPQASFRVGIDPTGGTDPFAETVVWGQGCHIYNVYHEVPAVQAVAMATTVTFFTQELFLYPLKHVDGYIDSASLEVVSVEPEPPMPPAIDYDYPVVKQGSKLHMHGIGEGGSFDILRYLAQNSYTLPYTKILATDPSQVQAVVNLKALSPNTKFIVRIMSVPGNGINIEGPGYGGSAQAYMDALLPTMRKYKDYVEYWELWNEDDPVGEDGHVQMAEFAVKCMNIAATEGFKLAVMSYSMGCPENNEWRAIFNRTQFFQTIKKTKSILSLHAYGNTNSVDSVVYIIRRHEWLYNNLLIPNNLVVPFIFTEYNVDGAINTWTPEALMTEFGALDDILSEWYYCLGASVFTFGMDWPGYYMDPLWKPFADLLLARRDVLNTLPPDTGEPEPPVPPQNCPTAREPYERTYALLPPGYGFEWVTPLKELFNKYFFTIGCSADDAFARVINVSKCTVLALNPEAWNGDLKAFWQTHYQSREDSAIVYVPISAATPAEWAAAIKKHYEGDSGGGEEPPSTTMQVFSQRNPLWSSMKLGKSSLTVGGSGCAMVGTAMIGSLVNHSTDPGKLCEWLNNNGGFTADGNLYWAKPAQYYDLAFVGYYTWRETGQVANMSIVAEALARGPVIIQVDFAPATAKLDTHFVVATKFIDNQSDIEIADPWTGTITTLKTKYWRGSLAASIKALVDYRIKDATPLPPTPQPDFVLGAHSAPVPYPTLDNQTLINRLKELGVKEYKMLDDGNTTNDALIKLLLANGITPIVRMIQQGQFPNRLAEPFRQRASRLRTLGVTLFEIGNEPNLSSEWQSGAFPQNGWQDTTKVNAVAANWWADAVDFIAFGGKPAFYAMAPTERGGINALYSSVMWARKLIDWLAANKREEMIRHINAGNIWLAVHTSPFSRPFDYNPVQAFGIDDMCLRGYVPLQAYFKEKFGVIPVTRSTEGGVYSPSHMVELSWDAPYTWETWGQYTLAMHNWLKTNGNLKSMCTWVFSDEGSPWWPDCGWYDKNGNPRTPVVAMRGWGI